MDISLYYHTAAITHEVLEHYMELTVFQLIAVRVDCFSGAEMRNIPGRVPIQQLPVYVVPYT